MMGHQRNIMHMRMQWSPDLVDPTGSKEEQLYMCRSAPPTPRVPPKRPCRVHKGKQVQAGPASKNYPRLRGPRARKRRGGQRCVLLMLWNTSFDVAPNPSSSLCCSVTPECSAASRGHLGLGLDGVGLALVGRRVHDGGAVLLEGGATEDLGEQVRRIVLRWDEADLDDGRAVVEGYLYMYIS